MDLVSLLVGIVLGAVVGLVIGKFALASKSSNAGEFAAATERVTAQAEQIEYLKSQLATLTEQERARLNDERAVLERLAPVQTLLAQVEGRVRDMENERKTQFQSIKDQLDLSRQDAEALRQVTQGLKTALSDPNIRGHWGETQVERLFEAAGLVKGVDYITQDQIAGDDGEKGQRPDAIVLLPDGGRIIVDAKVTLTNYLRASEEADPKSREALLKAHAKDVATKAKELGDKKYWKKYDDSAEYVIMFMPTEAALAEALQIDPSIYDTALKMNVAIATPISLFTTLKSVAFLWRQHAETNEIHDVISKTRALIGAIARTATEVNKFANSLNATVNNYNGFASWFENSLIDAATAIPGVSSNEFPEIAMSVKKPREIKAKRVELLGVTDADLAELDTESTMDSDDVSK
jgi:DNA recombination protein RmuC